MHTDRHLFDEMPGVVVTGSSKRVRQGDAETGSGVDMISKLSDVLLHRVLSFLPMTQEVVCTSALSSRWRNVWASMPCLRVETQELMDNDKLEEFMNHVMRSRDINAPLDDLRIRFPLSDKQPILWMRYAIERKAYFIHFEMFCKGAKLDGPPFSASRHLKRIELGRVSLFDNFFRPLNHACPLLQDVVLECCHVWTVADISSRSLKSLRIFHCSIKKDLLICAANLADLCIISPECMGAFILRNLSSLVTASIDLRASKFHGSGETILEHQIILGLSHATNLELYAPAREFAFERCLEKRPVFSNLRRLVLGEWCLVANCYPLRYILHHSLKLKELNFKLGMDECKTCNGAESSMASERALPPNHPHVEYINIYCSKDDIRIGTLVEALRSAVFSIEKIKIMNVVTP